MLIQNISFFVDPAVEEEFLSALRKDFIPVLLAGEKDLRPILSAVRPLTEDCGDQPRTFALQLTFNDGGQLISWQTRRLEPLLFEIAKKWPEKVLSMPTLLEPLSIEP